MLEIVRFFICIVHEQMAPLPVIALAAVLFFSGASQRVFPAESQPHVLCEGSAPKLEKPEKETAFLQVIDGYCFK